MFVITSLFPVLLTKQVERIKDVIATEGGELQQKAERWMKIVFSRQMSPHKLIG